jgi:hypothetical protein
MGGGLCTAVPREKYLLVLFLVPPTFLPQEGAEPPLAYEPCRPKPIPGPHHWPPALLGGGSILLARTVPTQLCIWVVYFVQYVLLWSMGLLGRLIITYVPSIY